MDDAVTLSAALTTCNGAKYLDAQLESIAKQTRRPNEIVASDDASTDDTVSIIQQFSRTAPFPIRLHKNAVRLGWARNFVHVAQLCSGELIAFCDQDDVWLPTKLERCITELSAADVSLVYHDALTVTSTLVPYGSLKRLPLANREGAALDLPPFANPYGFTIVFRRGLLDFSDLYDLSLDPDRPGQPMAHDQFFFFLASALGRVRYVPETLVYYRQHGGNVVGPGVRKPLSYRLRGITESECMSRAAGADSRARMLGWIIKRSPPHMKPKLELLRARYIATADRYRLRAIAHGRPSLPLRLRAVASLWPAAYRGDPWSFGWKACLKDLYAALQTQPGTVENATLSILRKMRHAVSRALRR